LAKSTPNVITWFMDGSSLSDVRKQSRGTLMPLSGAVHTIIPDAVQHEVLHCRSGTHPG